MEAMTMLISIKDEALENIEEVRERLSEVAKAKNSKASVDGTSDVTKVSHNGQDKGKGVAESPEPGDNEDEVGTLEDQDDDEAISEGGNDAKDPDRRLKSGYQLRLRECRVILHQTYFLLGDVYHQMGKSKEEDENYQAAELLRRDLLSGTARRAAKAMQELTTNEVKNGIKVEDLSIPYTENPGTKTEDLVSNGLEFPHQLIH